MTGTERTDRVVTGICLPGGGAAGANQAGMLMALQAYRHRISFMSSASVGGLNGVLFVANRLARLEELWRNITPKQVYRKWTLFIPGGRRLLSAGPLESLLCEELATADLIDAEIELFSNAVEIGTGDTFVASSKGTPAFGRWLMASASLPVVFGPLKIRGCWYVDGGVSDNTPLKPLIRAGCNLIIVLHCRPSQVKPLEGARAPSRLEQATGQLGLSMRATQRQDTERLHEINRQVEAGTAALGKRHIDLIEIFPKVEIGTLEFDSAKTGVAMTSSQRIAEQRLAKIDFWKSE